jgi:hypothetical protein
MPSHIDLSLESMRVALVGLALALLTGGCGGVKPIPAAPQQAPPTQSSPPTTEPAAPPVGAASTAEANRLEPPVAAPAAPPQTERLVPPAAANKSTNTESPTAKTPAKAAAPAGKPSPKETAREGVKNETAQEMAKQKAEPPLDLASLETRLKDTKAIGVLTKIALKNQVDDLLNQFRAFYSGKLKTTLADLRHPYDLLVLKVLSLLQDSDPSLAAAIVASREAIWGILSDPIKFARFASS